MISKFLFALIIVVLASVFASTKPDGLTEVYSYLTTLKSEPKTEVTAKNITNDIMISNDGIIKNTSISKIIVNTIVLIVFFCAFLVFRLFIKKLKHID